MHARALGVDGDLGRPFRVARQTDGLADEQAPALQAWMLASGDDITFNAS